MVARKIFRGFLDAVYPPICLICGRLSNGTYPHCCTDCFDSFVPIGPSSCELCGEPFATAQCPHLCLACIKGKPPFEWCRGVYLYQGAVAEALAQLKYKGQISMKGPLQEALLKGVNAIDPFPEAELVVPVPLSRRGLWHRGFNQSYLLALQLSVELNLKLQPGALKKIGNRAQVGLAAKERDRNAMKSFEPGGEIDKVKGRNVLLFDDVYTTGATVRRCARILRSAGAEVSVLTFARAGSSYVRKA